MGTRWAGSVSPEAKESEGNAKARASLLARACLAKVTLEEMAEKRKTKRVVVMGLGNLLLSDEGFGVHVYRKLEEEGGLSPEVEVFEAGTASLDALQTLGSVDRLVAVDAVKGGGEPGDIYRFKPQDIKSSKKISTSLHQLSFLEALQLAGHTGRAPKEVIIIGIEPKKLGFGMELSPELADKVPRVMELVREAGEKR